MCKLCDCTVLKISRLKITGGFDPSGAVVNPLWKSAKLGLGAHCDPLTYPQPSYIIL